MAGHPARLKSVTTMKQATIRVVLFWIVLYLSAFLNLNSNVILGFPVLFFYMARLLELFLSLLC
jgi:hypothetical protein